MKNIIYYADTKSGITNFQIVYNIYAVGVYRI